jgi:hypothetical protein
MTVTGPAVTLQVRDDDKVLEPQRAWARTRPRGCWSGRGSPSFRGTASGRPAPDSSGSTSPPVPRCSPKPWNASREQPVLGDGDWISAMTVLSGRGLGNRHRADPRAARWRPDPSRQGHREIPRYCPAPEASATTRSAATALPGSSLPAARRPQAPGRHRGRPGRRSCPGPRPPA